MSSFAFVESHKITPPYSCPRCDIPTPLWNLPTDRLIGRLERLCSRQVNPHSRKPYEKIRNRFWSLNVLLNNCGDVAPRFRPTIPTPKPPLESEDQMLSNDKQVLDLHWLSVQEGRNGSAMSPMALKWRHMFENELDLDAAAKFVKTVGNLKNKVGDLALSKSEQMKLQVIQSDAVRKYWQEMKPKKERLHAALMDQATRNTQLRGKEKIWADAWLAGKLAGYAGGSAVEWYGLISGREIKPSTLSQIRKRIEKDPKLNAFKSS